jgi:hypothetical protein
LSTEKFFDARSESDAESDAEPDAESDFGERFLSYIADSVFPEQAGYQAVPPSTLSLIFFKRDSDDATKRKGSMQRLDLICKYLYNKLTGSIAKYHEAHAEFEVTRKALTKAEDSLVALARCVHGCAWYKGAFGFGVLALIGAASLTSGILLATFPPALAAAAAIGIVTAPMINATMLGLVGGGVPFMIGNALLAAFLANRTGVSKQMMDVAKQSKASTCQATVLEQGLFGRVRQADAAVVKETDQINQTLTSLKVQA